MHQVVLLRLQDDKLQQLIVKEQDRSMLKSLLTKIKSEKSEVSSQQSGSSKPEQLHQLAPTTKQPLYPQLTPLAQIDSDVHRIRYVALEAYTQLYNSILACPISSFNLLPYAKRKVKEIDLAKHPLPHYMSPLLPILSQQLPSFNHLLINVYSPGVGIMPHFDGPLYTPKVVVLSLGGPAVISFTDSYSNNKQVARLLLEDQSIHIFQEEAYLNYLHGIESFTIDSVFIQLQLEPMPKVVRSSVANFHLTRIHRQLISKLKEGLRVEEEEVQLGGENSADRFWVMPIKQNAEYNFKLEMARQERISITVRQRLSQHSQPPP